MLVQTSMAHAFSNIRVAASAQTVAGAKIGAAIYDALRTKQGTINVPDRINLTSGTYRRCRAVDMLPAHMM